MSIKNYVSIIINILCIRDNKVAPELSEDNLQHIRMISDRVTDYYKTIGFEITEDGRSHRVILTN